MGLIQIIASCAISYILLYFINVGYLFSTYFTSIFKNVIISLRSSKFTGSPLASSLPSAAAASPWGAAWQTVVIQMDPIRKNQKCCILQTDKSQSFQPRLKPYYINIRTYHVQKMYTVAIWTTLKYKLVHYKRKISNLEDENKLHSIMYVAYVILINCFI